MQFRQTTEELTNLLSGEIRRSEPMSKHTSWRVGGPADIFALPKDIKDVVVLLQYASERDIPYTIIGNGSNLLVRDGGIRGLVIKIAANMAKVEFEGCKVKAMAGVALPRLAQLFLEHQLAGMEFAAGIPAALGGAVVMNAGAHGGQISDLVIGVTVVDRQGKLREIAKQELAFAYRQSNLTGSGLTVLAVTLEAREDHSEAIRDRMQTNLRHRHMTQPQGWPSAGSVFKNIPGQSAGKLIDELGIKGLKIGGAVVSEQHANFIINTGEATAQDILTLIEKVRHMVLQHYQLLLEPEVRILGEG